MNISVIGVGYVGLVSAACLASMGNHVTCIDKNNRLTRNLSRAKIHFFEPSLQELVDSNSSSGNLRFSVSYRKIAHSECIFVCVNTPADLQGKPNLTNFDQSIDSILRHAKDGALICIKSTVPLGTHCRIQKKINLLLKEEGKSLYVCSNPEFLKEGSAVQDFLRPDRIIIGTNDEEVKKITTILYRPLNQKRKKMIFMSPESAELTKYAANAYLATRISFINEISALSESVNADINEIRYGMGSDQRIGNEFLYAGIGFGGSCFPKDLQALISFQKDALLEPGICEAAFHSNKMQVLRFAKKIKKAYGSSAKNKKIAIWGLSFKPNTDDIRESPAIKLVRELSPHFSALHLYDPIALSNAKNDLRDISNLRYFKDKYTATNHTHGLVLCTEWKEFWNPDFPSMQLMKENRIFDGRNAMNKSSVVDAGYVYNGIGIT